MLLRPSSNGRLGATKGLPRYNSRSDGKHRRSGTIRLLGVQRGFPNLRGLQQVIVTRFKKRSALLIVLASGILAFIVFALLRRFGSPNKSWPGEEAPTLIFRREDLKTIWRWEIASGHYPSRRSIPQQLGLDFIPENPALPPRNTAGSRYETTTNGIGPERLYQDIQCTPPHVAYPPRPIPGSAADLDLIMEHCDFEDGKYVRDCLEVLRVGGGLDNGNRLRRGSLRPWDYIYTQEFANNTAIIPTPNLPKPREGTLRSKSEAFLDNGFIKSRRADWESSPIPLPPPRQYQLYSSLPSPCDSQSERIFHVYWTGPFTDKPYLAILSFLFTQNTGLHLRKYPADGACRPKLWMWINPGPASIVPDSSSATEDLMKQLKANPWAAPFLHPRFSDVVQLKLWNTTEQLDSVAELKDDWRLAATLFKSGGHAIKVPAPQATTSAASNSSENTSARDKDDVLNRMGSQSQASYDRLSTIMSDMARFILTHRFGGTYVDADTLFLRDWEELWGWKGAFAYRWSWHDKYNTAILHLNKGSALGKFLLRTALKNDLDFHPMTISNYLKEAQLERLLFRLPDALFDSAWLNMEGYQRERPPQPFFTRFEEFFETPLSDSAAPLALGFEGFFRGSYSYHFHNSWWRPADRSRNWPDMGPRFHEAAQQEAPDRRDLDWSTILKRTFEAYIRGERPNMYGEWLLWP